MSYYAGDWLSNSDGKETHLLTINSDGSIIVKKEYNNSNADTTISSTSIKRNSDTSYTFDYYDSSQGNKGNITLNFSSSTQGTFTGNYPDAENQEDPLNITKK